MGSNQTNSHVATTAAPLARLFTAPGCPHCGGVKRSLEKLLDEKVIGELEVIDITQQPDIADSVGVRSVPWLELGRLTFTGEQKLGELREWAQRLAEPEAMIDYYQSLLANGELAVAEQTLHKSPSTIDSVLLLMARDEIPLQVRIGAVALLEGFSGEEPLQRLIPAMVELLIHHDYRVRADIAYLLGLTASSSAIEPLKRALEDEHREVREIAAEALEELEMILTV